MREILIAVLLPLWLGGMVYCLLSVWAAVRFRSTSRQQPPQWTPFASLLKPLSGLENGLEPNLETFFQQDYPSYELLFAVNESTDPALEVVASLQRKYPHVPVTVVEAANSPYPSPKVFSLEKMGTQARGDLLVISDSDVFVDRHYVREVIQPFADPKVGVVTCLYRGVAGNSFWSRLEAVAMSAEFMLGVLVAWALEPMKFALGPTMAVRRSCLEAIGGFPALGDYYSDDFELGRLAAQAGYSVELSPHVVNHQVLGETFQASFLHRVRWARSTRFSRPWGYLGQAFTYPVLMALGLVLLTPHSPVFLWALAAAVVLRSTAGLAVGWGVLRDRSLIRWWWLIPLEDLLGFAVWCGGVTGRQIRWRHTVYRFGAGGRLERIGGPSDVRSGGGA